MSHAAPSLQLPACAPELLSRIPAVLEQLTQFTFLTRWGGIIIITRGGLSLLSGQVGAQDALPAPCLTGTRFSAAAPGGYYAGLGSGSCRRVGLLEWGGGAGLAS